MSALYPELLLNAMLACGTSLEKPAFIRAPQRVVSAANRYPNGVVIVSARHHDVLMNEQIQRLRGLGVTLKSGEAEQGFIDQFGTFLSREQAWMIAQPNGQVRQRVGGDEGCLYSENLY